MQNCKHTVKIFEFYLSITNQISFAMNSLYVMCLLHSKTPADIQYNAN